MITKALLIAKTITAGAIILLQTGYANADLLAQQQSTAEETIRTACLEQGGVPDIQPDGTNCSKYGGEQRFRIQITSFDPFQLDIQSNLSVREATRRLADMCIHFKSLVFFSSKEGQVEIACSPAVFIEGTPSVQLTMTVRPEHEGSGVSFAIKPCGPVSSVTQ